MAMRRYPAINQNPLGTMYITSYNNINYWTIQEKKSEGFTLRILLKYISSWTNLISITMSPTSPTIFSSKFTRRHQCSQQCGSYRDDFAVVDKSGWNQDETRIGRFFINETAGSTNKMVISLEVSMGTYGDIRLDIICIDMWWCGCV